MDQWKQISLIVELEISNFYRWKPAWIWWRKTAAILSQTRTFTERKTGHGCDSRCPITWKCSSPWWRHQMETFSALLAICAENSPVPDEFPAKRPVARSFDVFFDLHPNKGLSKQCWGWWFETLSCQLWRHRKAQQADYILPLQFP